MSGRDNFTHSEPASAKRPATLAEWTLAIDLAAGDPSRLGRSQKEKLSSVREIAAQTKNKPIVVLLQEIAANPRYGEDGRACQRFILKHQAIRNGKLETLESTYSSDLASDTAGFLDLALKDFPSQKTGLFLHCHGKGNRGFNGDAGHASLPQFSRKLRQTLDKNKIGKLDILNLDCCLMSQDGVLGKVQTITKDLVTSSEIEFAFPGMPAQNTKASIESLLANPQINGGQFADLIVQQTKNGTHDCPSWNSTTTANLAHFRLEQNYQQFHKAVDLFGTNLCQAIAQRQNKTQIEKIVADTPRLSGVWGSDDRHCVDLKSFAQKVQESIDAGRLKDPRHRLQQSIKQLIDSHEKMTASYSGVEAGKFMNSQLSYDRLGGINVFLPSKQLRDIQKLAQNNYIEYHSKYGMREIYWGLRPQLEKIKSDLNINEKSTPELKPLAEFVSKSEAAQAGQTTPKLQAEFCRQVKRFRQTPAYARLIREKISGYQKDLADLYQKELLDDNPGWAKFIHALSQN